MTQSNELSNALLSVIQKASETNVTGPSAMRAKRMRDASDQLVVLADVSGSMMDIIGLSGLPKEHHLAIALADVVKYHPAARIFAFASRVREVKAGSSLPGAGISALGGGTDMAQAILSIAPLKPRKTIIISDGLPDDPDGTLTAADAVTGSIDTIYCGPDSHPAVLFLQKLSRSAGGDSVVWDGYGKALPQTIRALLE